MGRRETPLRSLPTRQLHAAKRAGRTAQRASGRRSGRFRSSSGPTLGEHPLEPCVEPVDQGDRLREPSSRIAAVGVPSTRSRSAASSSAVAAACSRRLCSVVVSAASRLVRAQLRRGRYSVRSQRAEADAISARCVRSAGCCAVGNGIDGCSPGSESEVLRTQTLCLL
jgi:hypothetical protein